MKEGITVSKKIEGAGRSRPAPEREISASLVGIKNFFIALTSKPASALGLFIFIFFLFLAIFGPLIAPYGINEQIVSDAGQPPSPKHWFGTDNLGRDVFSRVVFGAREILSLAGFGTLVAVFFWHHHR
ncbi:MAG: hypothetical protein ACK44E_04185, partial [Anaerolineales bacterium]